MPFATPKSHLIRSIRDAGGTALHWLLLEGIDNSFDYHANQVVVLVDTRSDIITIIDNGDGITKDRIDAPITLGDHRPSASGGGLGRFGVGITTQAIKHGDILQIETVSADGKGTIEANWAAMLKRGDWYYPDSEWRPTLVGVPTGTTVSIRELLRAVKAKDIERACEEIAHRFYPALASGRQIVVNGNAIPILAEPLLSDVIQCTLTFDGGRVAKIRAGLLKNPAASSLRRVHVSYLHRVIKPNCGFACDGYSGIENMFARVELSEQWRLTQYKDDVLDSEELEDKVSEAIEPILEKCHARSMTLDLQVTIEAVHELLGEAAARPRRKKATPTPQPPKARPDKPTPIVDDSSQSASGPVKKKRPRAKLHVEFPPGKTEADQWGVGTVDLEGRVHRVLMPRDNPEIAEMLSERDISKRAKAITRHASMLYIQARRNNDLIEDFGLQVWNFINSTSLKETSEAVAAQ